MQQALEYSEILQIPFIFTSNGDSFVFHDKTNTSGDLEKELSLDDFPSPETLWQKYLAYKNVATPEAKEVQQSQEHSEQLMQSCLREVFN